MYTASSLGEARQLVAAFRADCGKLYAKAVASLDEALGDLFTHMAFPGEDWRSIKSTNVIASLFAGVKLMTDAAKRMLTECGYRSANDAVARYWQLGDDLWTKHTYKFSQVVEILDSKAKMSRPREHFIGPSTPHYSVFGDGYSLESNCLFQRISAPEAHPPLAENIEQGMQNDETLVWHCLTPFNIPFRPTNRIPLSYLGIPLNRHAPFYEKAAIWLKLESAHNLCPS